MCDNVLTTEDILDKLIFALFLQTTSLLVHRTIVPRQLERRVLLYHLLRL